MYRDCKLIVILKKFYIKINNNYLMNYLKKINIIKEKAKKNEYIELIEEKKELKFNIGLAFLRPILQFFVILTHCYNYNFATGLWELLIIKFKKFGFHVLIFFLMSFYFSQNTLSSSNYKKKFERFERICIPYLLWPIIIYYLNKLLIRCSITKNEITIKDLIHQLIFGSGNMSMNMMWYQWNTILITIVFNLIIFVFRNNYNFAFIIIAITAFIFQYNGNNVYFFSNYIDYTRTVFGRVIEMIPYTVIGFLISYSKIIIFLTKYRLQVIIACIYFLYFLINYEIFYEVKGYGCCGVSSFLKSICTFIIFAMFPSEKIKNKVIIKIIKQITNYTAGIYFLHMELSTYLSNYIIPIKDRTIKGCIILYLICYLCCFLGSHIFGKTKLRHLFE